MSSLLTLIFISYFHHVFTSNSYLQLLCSSASIFTSFLHLLYSSFLLPLQTHAVCLQKQEKESLTQLYKIHLLLLNVNSLTQLYKIHLLLLNVNSLTQLYKIHLLLLNVNSFLCFCQKISPSCGLKKFSHF